MITQRTASSSWFMYVAFIFVPFRSGKFDCARPRCGRESTVKVTLAGAPNAGRSDARS